MYKLKFLNTFLVQKLTLFSLLGLLFVSAPVSAEMKGFESWEKMLDAERDNIEITEEKENTDNRKDEDGFEQKD